MNEQEQIAFGNLRGEVRMLGAILRALAGQLEASPALRAKIMDALDAERAKMEPKSPERISFEHAVNSWRPHDWLQNRR